MQTAKEILQMEKPGELFTNNADIIRKEYLQLSKKWHPDYNGNSGESNEVMTKINQLYDSALGLIKNNSWESKNIIQFYCTTKEKYEFKYLISYSFELGQYYIGHDHVIYIFDRKHREFYDQYLKIIKNFKYANDTMKSEFLKCLPYFIKNFETSDGSLGVVVRKTPDCLLLKDILAYYKGNIPDRHVAWIMGSLYNIACFIDYNGLTHNGISLDNYYISPLYHNGQLLGGWWYSTNQEQNMMGVSKEIYDILPPKVRNDRVSNITTDLESIRFIGKQLLGEKNGCKVKYNKDLPKSFIDWLLAGSSNSAYEEYSKWNTVLTNSYGKRKFIEMNLSFEDLYSK